MGGVGGVGVLDKHLYPPSPRVPPIEPHFSPVLDPSPISKEMNPGGALVVGGSGYGGAGLVVGGQVLSVGVGLGLVLGGGVWLLGGIWLGVGHPTPTQAPHPGNEAGCAPEMSPCPHTLSLLGTPGFD